MYGDQSGEFLGALWEMCKWQMSSFRIDLYIKEDLRYQNYWFAADIMVAMLVKKKTKAFPPPSPGSLQILY